MDERVAPSRRRILGLALAFELGLGVLALPLGWLFHVDPFAGLRVGWGTTAWGVVACLPLVALLPWLVRSRWKPVADIRELLERDFLPLFARSRSVDLALVAAAAGLGEELLFRAVLQTAAAVAVGPVPALVGASVLFGLAHAVTRAYAVLATLVGAYLGGLYLWTGELWLPVLAHALYDLVALRVLLARMRP